MAKKPEKPEKSEKPEKTEPPEKPEPADLLALVAALHRQHRRLRWTVVALTLVTLVALAGAGAALLAPYNAELGLYLRRWLGRPETIAAEKTILEAEKFALRTPDGKVRAALAAHDDATPSLALYDDDGTARAGLELGTDGQANLWFAGKDGQVTVSLNPPHLSRPGRQAARRARRAAEQRLGPLALRQGRQPPRRAERCAGRLAAPRAVRRRRRAARQPGALRRGAPRAPARGQGAAARGAGCGERGQAEGVHPLVAPPLRQGRLGDLPGADILMSGTALGHLRLLDLSRQLPGPFCSTLLADLGMDVLVVAAPQDPFGVGIPFLARNKRSMTLNLKHV